MSYSFISLCTFLCIICFISFQFKQRVVSIVELCTRHLADWLHTSDSADELHTSDLADESHTSDSTKSSRWYLDCARKCMELSQQMTSRSMSDQIKFNHKQCDYLAKELKVAVEKSEQSFKRSSSLEHQAECVEVLKLLHKVSSEINTFIQGCCQVSLVAVSASASVPIRVSSWSYHLKLCTELLCNSNKLGAAWRTWKDLNGISEDIFGCVQKMAKQDKALSRNLKSKITDHEKLNTIIRGCMDFSKELSLKQVGVLGKGSASIVHTGTWEGEQVAIKTYYDVDVADFKGESSALLSLCHPNIVNMFGYTLDKGKCSIVMELMDGNLFSEMLSRLQKSGSGAAFTILEAVGIIRQIAEAMKYLHECRISHGELKTRNILVKMEMGLMNVKLGDFKVSNPDPIVTLLANKDATRWSAPEFMDPPSMTYEDEFMGDIYSFAMLCYELLTGNQPFSELTLQEAKRQVLLGGRPKLSDSCPPDLSSLIERCWNSKPSFRPSFVDVCEELKYLQCLLLSEPLAPQIQTHPLILPTLELPSDLLHMKVDYSCLDRGVQLGKGASDSIVYSTTWDHNGVKECVAQKLFFGRMFEDFKKEVQILTDLIQGPNVACLRCLAIDNRSCSIVMEKMDSDLNDLIRNKRLEFKAQTSDQISRFQAQIEKLNPAKLKFFYPLDLRPRRSKLISKLSTLLTTPPFHLHVASYIMLQIAYGVHYIHQKNIVHRDLKSSNIFISEVDGGKEFQVRVGDFGLSQMIPKPSSSDLDEPFNVGTLKWMAPEVMKPTIVTKSSYDLFKYDPFKSDVYSFGMVCFEILTGEVPTFETTHHNLIYEKALNFGVIVLLILLKGYKLKDTSQTLISTGDMLPLQILLLLNSKRPSGVKEHNDDEVRMKAVLAGSRPPFPNRFWTDYCPPQLEALIKNCWDSDFSVRPSFAEIVAQLELVQKSLQNPV